MGRVVNSEAKLILRDATVFSGATYFSQAMNYFRGFLNAKFLNPAGYGLWSAFGVFINYGDFSNLGILKGMNREIASNFKNDEKAVKKLQNVSFTVAFVSSSVVAALMILFFLIFSRPLRFEEVAGILTVGVLVIMNNLTLFFEMNNSAMQNFVLISKVNSSASFISLLLTLLIVFYLRIYGVFLVALFTVLYVLFFYNRASSFNFKFDFDKYEAFKLVKIGFPFIVLGLCACVRSSLNSLMILGILGKAALGLYAVANLLSNFLGYFPYTAGQVIVPRLYRRYGQTRDLQEIKRYLTIPTEVLSYLLPLIAGIFYFLFSFLIRIFLSAYTESIAPLFWLLFAVTFMTMPTTATAFATALDKQHILVIFNIISIIINLIFNYLFLAVFGLGIKGVALSVFLTFLFYTTCVLSHNLRYYLKSFFEYVGYFTKLYLPTAYILFILFTIKKLFGSIPKGFIAMAGWFWLQILLYLAFTLPVFILLNRRTNFLNWIQEFDWFYKLKNIAVSCREMSI